MLNLKSVFGEFFFFFTSDKFIEILNWCFVWQRLKVKVLEDFHLVWIGACVYVCLKYRHTYISINVYSYIINQSPHCTTGQKNVQLNKCPT